MLPFVHSLLLWRDTKLRPAVPGLTAGGRLWNPEKGTLIKTYKGHSYEVLDLDVISDNSQIVSVGEDKQVRPERHA